MRGQAMQPAPEVRRRLMLSRIEADTLKERDILCPICGFKIQKVFSDATGHLSVKCQKCKRIHILNIAYFRKIKGKGGRCFQSGQKNNDFDSNRASGADMI